MLVTIFWGLDFTKQACPEVLTGIWPTVGTDWGGEGANFKYHLSLSDSDRLRLLLKISRLAFLAALGRLQAIVGGGGGG